MQRPPKYASVRKSRTVDHVLLVEDPHSVCCTVRTLNAQHGYCPVLVGSFIACVYTGWAKKVHINFMAIILPNLNRFWPTLYTCNGLI